MRTMTRRATRDQLTKRNNEALPDGVGGTITGGPMEPIGLLEILERGARGASRGGAVSGAAQVAIGSPGAAGRPDRAIALSDGSRISFSSIADTELFRDDDGIETTSGETATAKNSEVTVSRDNRPPARRNDKARALSRALVSV